MVYVIILISLLLAAPASGELPVNYNPIGDPKPAEWGEIPEVRESDRGRGLSWMSEDFIRNGDGEIDWAHIDPEIAEGLRQLARSNREMHKPGQVETCREMGFSPQETSLGHTLAKLTGIATHVFSGTVIDAKQGFAPSSQPSTIYRIQPELTLKGEPTETPILVHIPAAKIQTSEGLICSGLFVDELPVTGARIVIALSDKYIRDGLWSSQTDAIFFQNPGGKISLPRRMQGFETLDHLEERIVSLLEIEASR